MTHISRFFAVLRLLPFVALATACSKSEPPVVGMKLGKPYSIEGRTYYPAYEPGYDKIGDASWYGPGFHGKFTASGEKFNQDDMTAAHPTLPMPSIVRVTNLANGKSSVVRINDRGPFKKNRIIDLSKGSATSIGLLSTGKVRVQYLAQETGEYLADLKNTGNKSIAMKTFTARQDARETAMDDADEQIVESSVVNTEVGQTVNEAAPIQSVSSGDLGGSVKGKDLPALADAQDGKMKVTPLVEEKRFVRDETGKPVHLQGATDHDRTYAEKAPTAKPFKPEVVKDAAAEEAPKAKAALAPSGNGGKIHIQVGSFASEENARKLDGPLSGIGTVNIAKSDAGGKEWWRVRLGPFSSHEDASSALDKVRGLGLGDARIIH